MHNIYLFKYKYISVYITIILSKSTFIIFCCIFLKQNRCELVLYIAHMLVNKGQIDAIKYNL